MKLRENKKQEETISSEKHKLCVSNICKSKTIVW